MVEQANTGDAAPKPSDTPGDTSKKLQIILMFLLGFATVGTAWAGFQGQQWGDEMTREYALASSSRTESVKSKSRGDTLASIDIAGFNQWLDATVGGETELAAIYERRFRDEMRVAFDAWQATDPFNNSEAPPGPFVMPEYQLADWTQADQYEQAASEHYEAALAADDIGDQYVIATLVFAITLFLGGISTMFDWQRAQIVVLAASALFAIYAVYLFAGLERISG